jgi:hypothetical protein
MLPGKVFMTPDEYVKRAQEIREAVSIYPELEVGEAYRLYKEAKGESAELLSTGDETIEMARQVVLNKVKKPCTQPGCFGSMLLEGVCEGCVEGKKGFKSKWTCEECLHRELLKIDYLEVVNLSLKAQNLNKET